TVNRRYDRVEKMARQRDKEAEQEYDVLVQIKEGLEEEKPVRALKFTEDEEKIVRGLHLLTQKPTLYVANVGEDEILDAENNANVKKVREHAAKENAEVII